ncbi:hypothetical protein [Phytomonospora endophytica]|uniref:Uncharacterized protein n=1 Tax=Phytomonospora endophytica TaxID=714109 RepID=A0A841FR36_9ACTN|nr:hypothetical protein [Phytomonospora endophytica]MBB6038655.1 hypothetical protein [Phytomonospora endophytica]GIG69201.1 hypothetical protein Pen01_54960 [Phytomonospora endophytica]
MFDDVAPFSDGGTAQEDSSSAPAGPAYTSFADFPGEELLYAEYGASPYRLRLKTVDTAWGVELADRVAAAGTHVLVIYIAVTGEAADRGVENVSLTYNDFELRFPAAGDACGPGEIDTFTSECALPPKVITRPETVADNAWHEQRWGDAASSVDPSLDAGGTLIAAVAFEVADDVGLPADTAFCAAIADRLTRDNCLAVTAPPLG